MLYDEIECANVKKRAIYNVLKTKGWYDESFEEFEKLSVLNGCYFAVDLTDSKNYVLKISNGRKFISELHWGEIGEIRLSCNINLFDLCEHFEAMNDTKELSIYLNYELMNYLKSKHDDISIMHLYADIKKVRQVLLDKAKAKDNIFNI